ncbi:PhoP regulatory network protein YrbL [Pluralibacter gergoviae]
MIYLSDTTPLGTGRHRKCYQHPTDAARCIKVVYNSESGGDKEIKRELGYYRHLSRRLQDWRGLPRYYGTVKTDCGTGYVYDAILDFDGKPSITLTEFAENCRYEEDFRTLRTLLKSLKQYLYKNRIVTMTLKPQNILCQRVSESEVVPVVCDNIGESTFLPVATWSAWFCHRKQERLWQRFLQQPALRNALTASSSSQGKTGASASLNAPA